MSKFEFMRLDTPKTLGRTDASEASDVAPAPPTEKTLGRRT